MRGGNPAYRFCKATNVIHLVHTLETTAWLTVIQEAHVYMTLLHVFQVFEFMLPSRECSNHNAQLGC